MKRCKLLIIAFGIIVLSILIRAGLLYWEVQLIQQETTAITQTITAMLAGYRNNDPEQIYAQRVPVEEGGPTSLDRIRFSVAGPDLEFELYQSMQSEVLYVSLWQHVFPSVEGRATALVTLKFENGCQIPYTFWLHQIDERWKVYDYRFKDMSMIEVRACIRGD